MSGSCLPQTGLEPGTGFGLSATFLEWNAPVWPRFGSVWS